MKPRARRIVAILAVALCCAGAAPALAQAAAEAEPFKVFAAEILAGLGAERGGERLKIAIWPFNEDEVPISPELASEFNARLLAALIHDGGGDLVFVEREELVTIIEEITQTSVFDEVENPVAALVQSAKVDALIFGAMRRLAGGDDVSLSYRAVRVRGAAAGEALAATSPQRMVNAVQAPRAALSLEQAAKAAAAHFRENASDMVEMKTGGIQFQTTGVQTDLAAFIEDEVVIALEDAFSDALSGRKLIVSPLGLSAVRLAGLDGAREGGAALRPQNFDPRPGVYTLTGRYWDAPPTIDLRLRLRDARGRSVSWRGHVPVRDLPPGLPVGLPGDFGRLTENRQGAIDFQLSSGQGRDPAVYEVGERLNLMMRTSSDAWVYCFYLQANRDLLKIFPNYLHDDPFLEGGTVHTVPGRKFPFNFDIREPAGIDLVKCFAASRDITAELPPELRSNEFEPLPPRMVFDLPVVFRAIAGAGMSEASLVITVNERAPE